MRSIPNDWLGVITDEARIWDISIPFHHPERGPGEAFAMHASCSLDHSLGVAAQAVRDQYPEMLLGTPDGDMLAMAERGEAGLQGDLFFRFFAEDKDYTTDWRPGDPPPPLP